MADEIGATEHYPQGKLDESDEGELTMAITREGDIVRIGFGKPVAWLAMFPRRRRSGLRGCSLITPLGFIEMADEIIDGLIERKVEQAIEVAAGTIRVLTAEIERLQAENERLKAELEKANDPTWEQK